MSGQTTYDIVWHDPSTQANLSEIDAPAIAINSAGEAEISLQFAPLGVIYTGVIGRPLTLTEFQNGVEVGQLTTSVSVAPSDVTQPSSSYLLDIVSGVTINGQFDAYPCFAAGTRIGTPSGQRRIEQLRAGETVSLATGGSAQIVWLGHRRQANGKVVRVRVRALGPGCPLRDLFVSADHALYIDGVLVQAGLLVNGDTIVQEHRAETIFWHIELDRHAIVLAEGAPAESYLDTGNRRQFSNCDLTEQPIETDRPPFAAMIFDGKKLETIRRRLSRPIAA